MSERGQMTDRDEAKRLAEKLQSEHEFKWLEGSDLTARKVCVQCSRLAVEIVVWPCEPIMSSEALRDSLKREEALQALVCPDCGGKGSYESCGGYGDGCSAETQCERCDYRKRAEQAEAKLARLVEKAEAALAALGVAKIGHRHPDVLALRAELDAQREPLQGAEVKDNGELS